MGKFLGLVMTPLDVQVEGLNAVMERIESTGATAINCSRILNRPATVDSGFRAPPIDIDGYDRVFDRPVWGKRELYLESFRSQQPNLSWYADTSYKPKWEKIPPDLDSSLPNQIYESARSRNWKVYISVTPLALPDLKAEDKMKWINGQNPDPNRRVANQGCPSSPNVKAWAIASVLDEISQQPTPDGVCLDWVEYTTYLVEDHFSCFSPYSQAHMKGLGYEAKRIKSDVLSLWHYFNDLTNERLDDISQILNSPSRILELLVRFPGVYDFFRFKSDVISGLYRDIRLAMDQSGFGHIELVANGWPSPFNRSSGMDYARLAEIVDSVRPKLYTFHWSVLPRWYGQVLKNWNPNLAITSVLQAIKSWFNLPDSIDHPTWSDYHIPAPNDRHPVWFRTFNDRINEVASQVSGRATVIPLAHGYVPLDQWKRTISIIRDSKADGMWVQRYCYLSDEKILALANIWNVQESNNIMATGSFF